MDLISAAKVHGYYVLIQTNNNHLLLQGNDKLLEFDICRNSLQKMNITDIQEYNLLSYELAQLDNDHFQNTVLVCNMGNDEYYVSKYIASLNKYQGKTIDAYIEYSHKFPSNTSHIPQHIKDDIVNVMDQLLNTSIWTKLEELVEYSSKMISTKKFMSKAERQEKLDRKYKKREYINKNTQAKTYGDYSKMIDEIAYSDKKEKNSSDMVDNVIKAKNNQNMKYNENTSYHVYKPLKVSEYNYSKRDRILNILEFLINTNYAYQIIRRLLTNPHTVHYIYCDKGIKLLNKCIEYHPKEKNLLYSTLYYGLYILSLEEKILTNSLMYKHRTIWDLNTAAQMPALSLGETSWSSYPYIMTPSYRTHMNYTMPFYLQGKRRICTLSEFQERLALLTNNVLNKDTQWFDYAYLTGSSMLACSAQTPLEFAMLERGKTLQDYFNYYYPGTHVSKNTSCDLDIAISCDSCEDFETKFQQFISQFKSKYNLECETVYQVKPYYKYVVTCDQWNYSMDVFPFIKRSIEVLVNKFHMPCIRQWYNGNVYLTTKCVAALLSGVNSEYTWVYVSNDIENVILKYAQRGYTTVLGYEEVIGIINYVNEHKQYSVIFDDQVVDGQSIFGYYSPEHKFFTHPNSGIQYTNKDNPQVIINTSLMYENRDIVNEKHLLYNNWNLIIKDIFKIYKPSCQL